jgi:crotonobetainyl-CoA:carnitine CoA-transferase CaiB-like acyl-CoA transferase
MLEHPQTQALGLLQDVPGSSIRMMGLPLRLDGLRPQPRRAAPAQGEANETLPIGKT